MCDRRLTALPTGKYTLYTTSQNPHGVRTALSKSIFNVPETKIHVMSPDVGGGFGMNPASIRTTHWPYGPRAAWAGR